MSSTNGNANLQAIFDEIKLDVVSPNYAAENAAKRREISRSFISDTITVPTEEMQAYAARASLGDDVYFDASTAALEAHIAKITGKEAGLFVPSGTASNQIAIRTHLKQPPYSVLADQRSHINKYEAGGTAFHSGAHLVAVAPSNKHHLTLEDIKENIIISSDIHFAPTTLVALENTLNGTILPHSEVLRIASFLSEHSIPLHLDGARIWHVALATSTPLSALCAPFASVSLCLSKGLGAPAGSVLVGSKEFIAKARWFRKLFGGGMRQTGVLAASAAWALTHNLPKLVEVHWLTRRLQEGLEDIGCHILSEAETCMVFYDPSPVGVTYDEIADRGSALPEPLVLGGSRLVVHIQTSPDAVEDFLTVVRTLAEKKAAEGFVPAEPSAASGFKDIYVRRAAKVSKPEVNGSSSEATQQQQ